jgi:hypothetical protein
VSARVVIQDAVAPGAWLAQRNAAYVVGSTRTTSTGNRPH